MIENVLRKMTGLMIKRFNGMKFTRINPDFRNGREREVGLYIHIPFCKSFCSYCTFKKFIYNEKKAESYIAAVKGEIDLYKERMGKIEIGDVYFGGGTPSLIPDGLVEITGHLMSRFAVNGTMGLEANPADISDNELICDKLKDAGFYKVGLGVQTFNDEILKKSNCRHNSAQSVKAVEMVMKKKLHLSVDMLLGLPDQNFIDVMSDIEKLVELGVPQICPYPVMISSRAKLSNKIEKGLVIPSEKKRKKMYLAIIDFLTQRGYNAGVWQFTKQDVKRDYTTCARPDEVIGLGVSAFSITSPYFYINTTFLEDYISSIADKRLPIAAGIGEHSQYSVSIDEFKGKGENSVFPDKKKNDMYKNIAEMKALVSVFARRGEIKKENFKKLNEIMAANFGFSTAILQLMKLLGIIKTKGEYVVLTKRGNYYFSVMAAYFMPVSGRYGEDILFDEPFPAEYVFELRG